jgi:signal peptidase II
LNAWGLDISPSVYILMIPILCFVYRYSYFTQKNKYFLSISIIFVCSGTVCSFFDKIVHGGTYDYIYLKQFGVFDLKDVYLTIGLFVLFQSTIYKKSWCELKNELINDPFCLKYFRYEYNNLKKLLSKVTHREQHPADAQR